VPNAREIDVGVLGNDDPQASVAARIVPGRPRVLRLRSEVPDGGYHRRTFPAALDEPQAAEFGAWRWKRSARRVRRMARVDFLLSRDSAPLRQRVNTIPGFTTISMFSQLWGATAWTTPPCSKSIDPAGHRASRREAALKTRRA
jgi:D-alanine-D-alanine ligase